MNPAYRYQITVDRWVDGDTFDGRVDLGFHLTAAIRFRLLGVDTPERGDPGYVEARHCAEAACPPGTALVGETVKGDKYGRWLIDIEPVRAALLQQGFTAAV